jgi:putative membrane protein
MPNYVSEPIRAFDRSVRARVAPSHDEPNHHTFLRNWAFLAAGLALALMLLPSAGIRPAEAQTLAHVESPKLSPADYNFVAQANLGAPFQIDSGRVAERKSTSPEIREYARLMVVTHIPVVDALNKILQQKGIKAPQNTLLNGAYDAMVYSLKADRGVALDRDYVEGQVEYQKGNAALFRNEIENGTDPELKEFARATLPKIEDHLNRALKLATAAKLGKAASDS